MNVTMARAVLTEQGIDPAVETHELTQLIEGLGWRVQLERSQKSQGAGRRSRWWRAEATNPRCGTGMVVSGPTTRNVLVRMLAQVLERDG